MNKIIVLAGLLSLVCFEACNNNKSTKYAVVNLDKGDSTFLALQDTAQAHLGEFTDSLKKHGSDEEDYMFIVKSDFVDGDIHEHMWSKIDRIKDTVLTGSLIDSPFNIKNYKMGQNIKVNLLGVEDWVIYDKLHDKKIGDYSSKYLKSKGE